MRRRLKNQHFTCAGKRGARWLQPHRVSRRLRPSSTTPIINPARAPEPSWHRRDRAKRAEARIICRLGRAAGLLGGHHSAQMPSWRDDPHDRHGVTAGWASANRLPGNYVDRLHAGTLPGPQFRLVKDAERAAHKERKDGMMGARQRDALIAALKKAPPPEPTRSTRNDSVKDMKIQALEKKVQALEKSVKTRARTPSVSRGRSGSRGYGKRDEPAPWRHGGGKGTATPVEAQTSRRARRAARRLSRASTESTALPTQAATEVIGEHADIEVEPDKPQWVCTACTVEQKFVPKKLCPC